MFLASVDPLVRRGFDPQPAMTGPLLKRLYVHPGFDNVDGPLGRTYVEPLALKLVHHPPTLGPTKQDAHRCQEIGGVELYHGYA
jgi:hypothetical protein